MRPIRILLGIAGISLLVGGSLTLRTKILHDRNASEINKLVADFKSKKIPTNGSEFGKAIPDEENAWLTVGPLLMEKTDKGAKILYKSGIAMDLLYTGKKHDLVTIEAYLQPGEQVRETVANAMERKPGFLVEHDYDEGPMLLLPEFAAYKSICKDYVLAAFAKALKGDAKGAKENLLAANRFAVTCLTGDSLISNLVGQSIRKMMYISALRIQEEASPEVANEITKLMLSKELTQVGDVKRVVEGEFILCLATVRNFDMTLADRPEIFYPLNLVVRQKELSFSEIESQSTVRHGDYVPNSRTMRAYFKTRLTEWQPLMLALNKYQPNQKLPNMKLFDAAIVGRTKPPVILKEVIYNSDTESIYQALGNDREYLDVSRAIWTAIQIKNKTGQYPKSLQEIGIPIRQIAVSETFSYKLEKGGVRIFGSRLDESKSNSVIQLSYPVDLHRSPSQISRSREVLNQYRAGTMNREGRLIPNSSKVSGP